MRIPEKREREKDVEAYLRKNVKNRGGVAYKFTSPARASVPDRIIVMPGGRIYFAEVKTTKGRLTKGQQQEIDRLRSLGQIVFVLYGRKDIDVLLGMIDDDLI